MPKGSQAAHQTREAGAHQAIQQYKPQRTKRGTFAPGSSGSPGGDGGRARRALNLATIREMHLAFARGGRKAIDKVMKTQPAVFLKLLVLLVPRELEVQHSSAIKQMSDEQIEAAIEAIETWLAGREAGARAKVIEGAAEPPALPAPPRPRASRRKGVGTDVGTTAGLSDSQMKSGEDGG